MFAQSVDANQFVARFVTAQQNNRSRGNVQSLGQKTDQRCVGFSFDRRCAQLDFDRAAMFAHHLVDLRVCNDVNANDGQGATVAGSRTIAAMKTLQFAKSLA